MKYFTSVKVRFAIFVITLFVGAANAHAGGGGGDYHEPSCICSTSPR